MREIITDWTTPGTSAGATVMYWRVSPPTAADQRAALNDFWTAVGTEISNAATWTIRTSGRELDAATGTLTGAWSETTPYTSNGGGASTPLADATQGLIRWNSSVIHGGRFIRGRTFIPSPHSAALSGGNLNPITQGAWLAAADALILTGTGLGIWSRPRDPSTKFPTGLPGLWAAAGSASVWSEFAVLTKRRG